MPKGNLSIEQWVSWLAATIVAAVTLTAFAYTNFQTKVEASEAKESIEKRLDRIEGKIDYLIQKEKE